MATNRKFREGIELVSLPDGSGLLSDSTREQCRTLNTSGKLICQCLIDGMESQEIIKLLKSHYAETEEIQKIQSDISEFLAELTGLGLLFQAENE